MKKFLGISLCILLGLMLWYSFEKLKAGDGTHTGSKEQVQEMNTSETEEQKQELAKETIEKALEEDESDQWVEEKLNSMTLEQKAAQLFVILPEALTGVKHVVRAGETSRDCYGEYPVGGIIYMAGNLQNPHQAKEMLENMMEFSRNEIGVPIFLCVDEEGGSVARIASNPEFNVKDVGDMRTIGESRDEKRAYEAGAAIGSYLKAIGFNVDFAPVADVLTNSRNQLLKNRSFGSDVQMVSDMAAEVSRGIEDAGIFPCVKHFPGHGNTEEDSHNGYAVTNQTLEEMRQVEFQPFIRQIDSGIPFIMVGHISAPNVTGEQTPASLSRKMITEILRNELKFEGIIITDALNMGAITNHYTSAEAAVSAFDAGADMLLMPQDFHSAYQAILEEIRQGRISEERLNASVERILKVKCKWKEKNAWEDEK